MAIPQPDPDGGAVALPRVAAILVVSDGGEWLGSVLSTLAAQRYPLLDLVVVDVGSTDSSAELLGRRIPADRLLTLRTGTGFGRAVAAALRHEAVASADLLWLLHDDLVVAPDALPRLVRALTGDPALAIVGPKLREWSDEYLLQQVGMTIDRFGRAESMLDVGELDQGQHDQQRAVLYTSTAGMLVRRDVLVALGGFDVRYPLFRDDLDLCWRAWLAGWRVEVVPRAVGYHVAAASRLDRRVGAGPIWQARYFAERHSLATLLKNYSGARLAWVLPVLLLLAVGKTVGFLATRRFGDATAVVRAYAWNVGNLGRTLRRRRRVQRRRRVADSELLPLFAPGLPRLRSYAEAVGSWLAGGTTRALIDDPEAPRPDTDEEVVGGPALVRAIKAHPGVFAGAVLLLAYVVGLAPLLGSGQVVGGDVGRWPDTAREFLRAYASPWSGDPVAAQGFGSPMQPLLGALSFAGLGSAWLAQRLIVFGVLPLAWLTALRAGRLITSRPAPRVLGATLYALNPVVLGALAQGRWGIGVAAGLLPALLVLLVRTADPTAQPATAWRAAALLALDLAVVGAAAPALGALSALTVLATLGATALRRSDGARASAVRLGVAVVGAVGLLAPWLATVVVRGGIAAQPGDVVRIPWWRAVTVTPAVLPALEGVGGWLAAATAVAIVVAAVLLGTRNRPGIVLATTTAMVVAAAAGWAVGVLGLPLLWTPALLLPAALAQAALAVVAARWLVGGLAGYAFGVRQLGTVLASVVLLAGLLVGIGRLAVGPWHGLSLEPELVPAFVLADGPAVGPYRILVLSDEGTEVRWNLLPQGGPSMTDFGVLGEPDVLRAVDDAVGAAVGAADAGAGARLGLLNVRYLVVVEQTPRLARALAQQPALEPLPTDGGRVYRVRSWLPRAVVVPAERGTALAATGDPGDATDMEEEGLRREGEARYRAVADLPSGGLLVLSEAASGDWRAFAAGRALPRAELPQTGGVNAWTVPPLEAAAPVLVRPAGGWWHRAVVAAQLLLLLGIVSLALRPPGFTQRRAERAAAALPADLSAPTDTDTGELSAVRPTGAAPAAPTAAPPDQGTRAPAPGAPTAPGRPGGPGASSAPAGEGS